MFLLKTKCNSSAIAKRSAEISLSAKVMVIHIYDFRFNYLTKSLQIQHCVLEYQLSINYCHMR